MMTSGDSGGLSMLSGREWQTKDMDPSCQDIACHKCLVCKVAMATGDARIL